MKQISEKKLEKQLLNYIIKARNLSLTDEEIKAKFLEKGYTTEHIEILFQKIQPKKIKPTTKKLEKPLKKELKKYRRKRRKRLIELWDQYEKGNVLKVGTYPGKTK